MTGRPATGTIAGQPMLASAMTPSATRPAAGISTTVSRNASTACLSADRIALSRGGFGMFLGRFVAFVELPLDLVAHIVDHVNQVERSIACGRQLAGFLQLAQIFVTVVDEARNEFSSARAIWRETAVSLFGRMVGIDDNGRAG